MKLFKQIHSPLEKIHTFEDRIRLLKPKNQATANLLLNL